MLVIFEFIYSLWYACTYFIIILIFKFLVCSFSEDLSGLPVSKAESPWHGAMAGVQRTATTLSGGAIVSMWASLALPAVFILSVVTVTRSGMPLASRANETLTPGPGLAGGERRAAAGVSGSPPQGLSGDAQWVSPAGLRGWEDPSRAVASVGAAVPASPREPRPSTCAPAHTCRQAGPLTRCLLRLRTSAAPILRSPEMFDLKVRVPFTT